MEAYPYHKYFRAHFLQPHAYAGPSPQQELEPVRAADGEGRVLGGPAAGRE